MKLLIIENLEPCPSPWLLTEYSYVSSLFPDRTVFTNVKHPRLKAELERIGRVHGISVVVLVKELDLRDVIVLDPAADRPLTTEEVRECDAVVIGGIMGDYPPKGRTKELITDKLPEAKARHLGKAQLTIAGAAYVLKRIEEGARLGDIEIRNGLTYTINLGGAELTIELPYGFPVENGKLVLPENYLEVVARRSVYYEAVEESDLLPP